MLAITGYVEFPRRGLQGDHLFGKPRNVGDFDSCEENILDFTKSQGNEILSGKSGQKLFIVSWIFVSVQVFINKHPISTDMILSTS